MTLNAGVGSTAHDIVLFTDSSQEFPRGALGDCVQAVRGVPQGHLVIRVRFPQFRCGEPDCESRCGPQNRGQRSSCNPVRGIKRAITTLTCPGTSQARKIRTSLEACYPQHHSRFRPIRGKRKTLALRPPSDRSPTYPIHIGIDAISGS